VKLRVKADLRDAICFLPVEKCLSRNVSFPVRPDNWGEASAGVCQRIPLC
jgi:hypothetical protein